jgi:hypothetical protein
MFSERRRAPSRDITRATRISFALNPIYTNVRANIGIDFGTLIQTSEAIITGEAIQ